MSATACALLRHDVRPRWVGDLLAAWCHTCQPGHLLIPETASPSDALAFPASGPRSERRAVPATAEPPPPA